MSVRIALNHRTVYEYERAITVHPQLIRLKPAAHCRTQILAYSLRIQPTKHFLNWQQDPAGNFVARVVVPERTRVFSFEVDLIAELSAINPFDFFIDEAAKTFPFQYDPALDGQLAPYRNPAPSIATSPRYADYLAECRALIGLPADPAKSGADETEMDTIQSLVRLNQKIAGDVRYLIRLEPGVQTPEETLKAGSGSCRDSATLLMRVLRDVGFAARFVSGYLIQLALDPERMRTLSALHPEAPQGPDEDFTDLHAWTEVYIPGAGWVGLDSTSGLLTGEGHIPLAATPDAAGAAPVTGATEPCESELDFRMSVRRLREAASAGRPISQQKQPLTVAPAPDQDADARTDAPESTKRPASTADIADIPAIAGRVDDDLRRAGIRLSMGGEPTFVAYDSPDADEWNLAALGPEKQAMATRLNRRLAERFAKGGVLYHGQGKWYPGEDLPRWAYGSFWLRDGQPLWSRPELLAAPQAEPNPETTDSEKSKPPEEQTRAGEFLRELTLQLGLDPAPIAEALEDPYHRLYEAGAGYDPTGRQQAELERLFQETSGAVRAYVLPLAPDPTTPETAWQSCEWQFKRGGLFLIPGDSPPGYRLPLKHIPHAPLLGYEVDARPDPIGFPYPDLDPTPESPLPAEEAIENLKSVGMRSASREFEELSLAEFRTPRTPRQKPVSPPGESPTHAFAGHVARRRLRPDARTEPGGAVFYTALVVDQRAERLHVFLPPLHTLEQYRDLVASVEATAISLGESVVLEGYPPPTDPRLMRLMVTPDPGVIEVNIHPAENYAELETIVRTVYDCARDERLIAEKFQLDGRPMGTGGGNHFTMGSPVPAESPFLRRPELLRSMITYWQHHPALSYFFSGLFVGPTSQAPRIDEARHDSLYDLERAFESYDYFQASAPEFAVDTPPAQLWLIDRLLRNVLVDLSGNTHRAEICIDKLFPGENFSGRLGLVELRAFEMPPGPDEYLAVAVLLRALIAWFARTPYHQPLIRRGTGLHDRYMLPFFLWNDLQDVLKDLQSVGYGFNAETHFRSHYDFRFPVYGRARLNTGGTVELELRQALEAWPVLGETATAGGMSRSVDAAMERVQVFVRGYDPDRQLLCCNGRAVPLQSAGGASKAGDEYVAGVRFKAWSPPDTLHPLAPVDSPLVFDLIDRENLRSLGGCRYYVSHPGGRSYEHRPVNAAEAEARRLTRFEIGGHTAGQLSELPRVAVDPEYPLTLDLRRRS